MRKSIFILSILLCICVWSFSQVQNKTNSISCGKNLQHTYLINGIVFFPKDQIDNRPPSLITFCNGSKHIYILEGLEIDEERFSQIGLKEKDILKKHSVYSYQYKNLDTTNCVELIRYYLKLSISVEINGIKITNSSERLGTYTEKKIRRIFIDKKHMIGNRFLNILTD